MTMTEHDIGVDMGGTFTDVVVRDGFGQLRIAKLPSSRSNPNAPISTLLERLLPAWGIGPAQILRLVHGTTVATNSVLERRGACVGLITTSGFADVLEIGSVKRLSQLYSLILQPVTPVFLAPRQRRKGVVERIESDGSVSTPLDLVSLGAACDDLVAQGVDAVAVCFLFSFLNPIHEQLAADFIRRRHPQLAVSISSEVDGAVREYDRLCVTCFDAYTKPLLDRYLGEMEQQLHRGGIAAPFQIMQSRGGTAGSAGARRRPVRLFLSGPAAGVVGASAVGRGVGHENIISVDVGGTSSDIAFIARGKPMLRPEGYVDGYQIRVPMVDVNAVGAGGGSIAWLDSGNGLRVGSRSAGAEPGPACYGMGGEDATVTDASVVLGWLDPGYFAGGTLALDADLAFRTVEQKIAKPLGIGVEDAALAIHRVVNAEMAEGIRLVSVRRGVDPRDFALLGFGGGGPIHAVALARELGIETVIIPNFPGVLSAIGLLDAPIEHASSRAFGSVFRREIGDDIARICLELQTGCEADMAREAVEGAVVATRFFADVCYVGQSHHLEVELDLSDTRQIVDKAYRAFLALHKDVYGHAMDKPARFVQLRTVQQAIRQSPTPAPRCDPASEPVKGTRAICLEGVRGRVMATVYDRPALRPGMQIAGPAIIEQADTTTVLEPGWICEVRPNGVLILTGNRAKAALRQSFDPVALEVIRHRLDGITNEMQLTLMRTSFSNIVKEGEDCSSAVFSVDCETISLALAHPIHMSTMIPGLKAILDDFPIAQMEDGDIYAMNDPYCGGTHLPDIIMAKPVFHDGTVIAFSVSLVHHQDVGGMTPGSIPPNATDIFQEGLRLPPLRVCTAGRFDQALLKVFRFNSRMPDEFLGDIDAQVSACSIGDRRLRELADTYTAAVFTQACKLLLDRSESMTRTALRQLPEGTYHGVEYLDNDGVDLDTPVRLEVAVTVRNGNFHVDFSGCGPQTRGPVNSTPSSTMAAVYWCIRALTGSEIPSNGGCFRPVTATLPARSVVHPSAPAPVNARAGTVKLLCSPIISAFANCMPDQIPAPSAHIATFMAFGGVRADGTQFVANQAMMGGTGASATADGVEFIETDVTNGRHGGVEVVELSAPVRIRRYELRADGGGQGMHRGGCGAVREIEFLVDGVKVSYRGERHFHPAPGLHGGLPGMPSRATVTRSDGRTEEIPSKAIVILNRGDVLLCESAGGGGWGDPTRRSAQATQLDITTGKVTLDAATGANAAGGRQPGEGP